MFLGTYEFVGEPDELLAAYDRMMEGMPTEGLPFHACVQVEGGIAIYDCCPTAEVFHAFSQSPELGGAMRAAGLPAPTVTPIGAVHVARSRDLVIVD
jgi:hypothetical protein